MMPGAIDRWLQRRVVEEATGAYLAWWQECTAVRDTYRRWVGAPKDEAGRAFAGYVAALEREQRAAEVYAAHAGRMNELTWPEAA
jgi:hypothetical protein